VGSTLYQAPDGTKPCTGGAPLCQNQAKHRGGMETVSTTSGRESMKTTIRFDASVSIIIPCWIINDDLLDYTATCIESIKEHCGGNEIVIVDNASSLGVSYMEQKADIYIRNNTNLGYGPAVNQGFEVATYNWLVACNNDIEFLDNWVTTAKKAWRPSIGAISSHLLDHDPKKRVGIEEAPKGHMFGALWLTHRHVLDEVGVLDEAYRMGMFEDRDLWERMERAGFKFRKVGHVNHIGNASWGNLPNAHEIYLENQSLFNKRWGDESD
jgi:GT2 family glycosyltransferase